MLTLTFITKASFNINVLTNMHAFFNNNIYHHKKLINYIGGSWKTDDF